jgi:diguanylate cyclase (GGDEF)-like protein/hemerythrin-like metal-binding protein/PAS domain S-box-containing protein
MDDALDTKPHRARSDFDPESLGVALAASRAVALAVVRHGRILFANIAFHDLFLARNTLVDTGLSSLVTEADRDSLVERLREATGAPATYSGTGLRSDGTPFELEMHLETSIIDGQSTMIVFASDVTERHRSHTQLSYLAYSDALTGLPNRPLFADRLRQAMLGARRDGRIFAVMMADLDGFKAVNDTSGHDAGDAVLQLVAQRLQACMRESDTLARLGGDEFAVVLPRLKSAANAAMVAGAMVLALRQPFNLGNCEVPIGVSVGIAVYPEHATTIDTLLAAADAALYRAKRDGRNRYCWAGGQFSKDALALPPMTWSIAHEVGIKEIDDQHTRLAAMIDALSALLRDGGDRDTILRSMSELVDYTEYHFACEEKLMMEQNVPNAAAHRTMHRRLLDDIRNLRTDQDTVSISLTLRYLQEWLLRHVDGMDKQLGRILISQGVR